MTIKTIPETMKCPSCGQESDTIKVEEQSVSYLYYSGGVWRWETPDANCSLVYHCVECGKELPMNDELKTIVESAE